MSSQQKEIDTAEGSTLTEIFGTESEKRSALHGFKFAPSFNHVMLFRLPFDPSKPDSPPKPFKTFDNVDKWSRHHVRLPCSMKNILKNEKYKWEEIEEALLKPIRSSSELEKAIKQYNQKYDDDSSYVSWKFPALHALFETSPPEYETLFFDKILPAIITIALQLPLLIPGSIPLLKSTENKSISMSQQQAACLLANAFLCTFPMRNQENNNTSLPSINFNRLFSIEENSGLEKLKCIINYFHRVLCVQMPKNVITFQRQNIDCENYNHAKNNDVNFSKIKFRVTSEGTIEDAKDMLQVDFANCLVGGGVLGHGCVQEEIRFVINPEMIVARLFTEKLDDNEALVMIGCEQFNQYRGYASTFEFAGDFEDKTPVDPYRRRMCRVVAIDALQYNNYQGQFKEENLRRELNKAIAGFSNKCDIDERLPIATGLWGCGAFNGHIIKSALIQLMACAIFNRNIVLYTFGDKRAKEEIGRVYDFLVKKHFTIGKLYRKLVEFGKRDPFDSNLLIPFIMDVKLQKKQEKTLEGIFNYEDPIRSGSCGESSGESSKKSKTKDD